MATSKMVEVAAHTAKPGPSILGNADALLMHRRGDEDAEARELTQVRRVVVRMALGRHACPELPACPTHGQAACSCTPCTHPGHGDDLRAGAETLRLLGLADADLGPRRTCQGCKRSVPSADLATREDGQSRCPACREPRPAAPAPPGESKVCSRCKVAKGLSEFHRNTQGVDGFHTRCKRCRAYEEHRRIRNRSRAAS